MTNHPNRSKGKLSAEHVETIKRAIELLGIAQEYINLNADTSNTINYDGTDCDGECLMDDMGMSVDDLREIIA